MIYNAQRKQVRDWKAGEVSSCPECAGALLARRGEIVIWHWAHHPNSATRRMCHHEETAWHLGWKAAYDELPEWQIEYPLSGYRADAVNPRTRNVREFVHSLSPYYKLKHTAYAALKYDVRWVIDGHAFASVRRRNVKDGGIARLLTPRAYLFHESVAGRCWVHYEYRLWREWKDNVWYPRTDDAAARMAALFKAEDWPPPPMTRIQQIRETEYVDCV